MNNDELPDIEFSLEPLEPLGSGGDSTPSKSKSVFRIDTRSGNDRRKSGDRRQTIRFEQDRRQGARRRESHDPWDENRDF